MDADAFNLCIGDTRVNKTKQHTHALEGEDFRWQNRRHRVENISSVVQFIPIYENIFSLFSSFPFMRTYPLCSVHSHLSFKVTGFYRPVKPSLEINQVTAILLPAYTISGVIVRTPLTNQLRVRSTPGAWAGPPSHLGPVGPPGGPVTSLG